MRFIHTADWHLGRIFHGVHLTDDQSHILDQFVDLVRDSNPDAIFISGDVYDRAVPPPKAVTLLDEILTRLVLDLKVRVILSSGNHDSPDRLGFAARLLEERGLHIVGSLTDPPISVSLEDKYGPVHIYTLPYAEPPVVRERLKDGQIVDHNSAMRALVDRIPNNNPRRTRRLLMAHTFAAGGEASESERPLSIGGTGIVDANIFHDFDYVALGHLHQSQKVGYDHLQYSGSLLKYSFSEASHRKSVNVVEMDANGNCRVDKISLTPIRDVRCIKGFLKDILESPQTVDSREDYLQATLLDTGAILDAIGKLRGVYPNVLHIDRPHLIMGGEMRGSIQDHRQMQDLDLFAAFFSQVTSDDLTDEQSASYVKAVDSLKRQERETFE